MSVHCYSTCTAMALEIFRLDGRVAQEPLKDNNTLDILSSASTSESELSMLWKQRIPQVTKCNL